MSYGIHNGMSNRDDLVGQAGSHINWVEYLKKFRLKASTTYVRMKQHIVVVIQRCTYKGTEKVRCSAPLSRYSLGFHYESEHMRYEHIIPKHLFGDEGQHIK